MSKNQPLSLPDDAGEFLLYQTEDGQSRIDVRMSRATVWLSQKEMAVLFQTTKQNVSLHLQNIYDEGELQPEATVKKYLTVQSEGARQVSRDVEHYSLEAILAVGYRVRSHRGTQFRVWATERLREYLTKGFTLDDERLKRAGGGGYFEELLARIRDIRSSERVFWRKVLDIYATSIDYDASAAGTELFFKTVQDKIHWAAHGHTAAEIIHGRANAGQPNMGLTTWAGERPRKTDVGIAKNYLQSDEIEALNRIVSAYLEFAELQALNRRAMHMADWIAKLDDFLRLSDREILENAGKISHELALETAEGEFAKYRQIQASRPQTVDEQFDRSLEELKQIEKRKPAQPSKKAKKKSKKPDKKSVRGKRRKPPGAADGAETA